jgi:hypothetical protein
LKSNKITQKVDQLLKIETQKFFTRTVQQNIKRWNSLQESFQKERQELKFEVIPSLAKSNYEINQHEINKAKNKISDTKKMITLEDLDNEAARLELDYNRNWFQYECFNLREAFQSQSEKIENDWKHHENNLMREFKMKREKITGETMSFTNDFFCDNNYQGGRWQQVTY